QARGQCRDRRRSSSRTERLLYQLALAGSELGEQLGEPLRTDVEVFADAAPQHRRRHVVVAAFFLQLTEHVEHDALLARQAIADVGYSVVAHCLRSLAQSCSSSGCPS